MVSLPDTSPNALVMGKHNQQLDMTIVKDLIIVMTAEKEVNCVIIYLRRKCGSEHS